MSTDQANNKPSLRAVEEFLFHEARLLDQGRLDEWGELFTDDGTYWVPATVDQPDPIHHVSLMYDDKLLRAVRIRRFADEQAIPLQPAPRGVHLVSNIEIDDYSSDTRECIVSSHFIVLQYQRNKQAIFGGSYTHTLRWDGDSFAIKQKKADLANCEASHESIHIIL